MGTHPWRGPVKSCPEKPSLNQWVMLSGTVGAGLMLGVWGRGADSRNWSAPQVSTRPLPFPTDDMCSDRGLVMAGTTMRQKEPGGPWCVHS